MTNNMTAAAGPLRVYLAGGAAERLTVCRPLVDRLLAAGVAVTYDWTRDPGWDNPAPTLEDLERAAHADLDAVRACDLLWYVAPAPASGKSEGSAGELCAALVLEKVVVVSGDWAGCGRIFPALAGVRCATHEEGLGVVVEMAGARA